MKAKYPTAECLFALCLFLGLNACAQPLTPEQGERQLSVEITTVSYDDYSVAFELAKSLGMTVTSLSLQWDELETARGVYGTEPDLLALADDFFPGQGIAISLMIGPIDTNTLRLPTDLVGKAFEDPAMIERFERLLDYVFAQIPDLELSSLAIGNEIGNYLGSDEERWRAYTAFFETVSAYVREKRPGLVVGSKIGFGGLTGNARGLSDGVVEASDAVMLTYYPLQNDFSVKDPGAVRDDFDTLARLWDKPLYVLETGYPSSPLLGSSESAQAAYIRELFQAWDAHAEQIEVVSILWLHDLPPAVVDELLEYYGLQDEKFRAYLASLGVRTFSGKDKAAYRVLQSEAKRRG